MMPHNSPKISLNATLDMLRSQKPSHPPPPPFSGKVMPVPGLQPHQDASTSPTLSASPMSPTSSVEVDDSDQYYKTKPCKFWLENRCERGEFCRFAHTNELRSAPDLSKTKLCAEFIKTGKCEKGAPCRFAHGHKELRATPDFFKTALCIFHKRGRCPNGSRCRHAHSVDELRPRIRPFRTKIPRDQLTSPTGPDTIPEEGKTPSDPASPIQSPPQPPRIEIVPPKSPVVNVHSPPVDRDTVLTPPAQAAGRHLWVGSDPSLPLPMLSPTSAAQVPLSPTFSQPPQQAPNPIDLLSPTSTYSAPPTREELMAGYLHEGINYYSLQRSGGFGLPTDINLPPAASPRPSPIHVPFLIIPGTSPNATTAAADQQPLTPGSPPSTVGSGSVDKGYLLEALQAHLSRNRGTSPQSVGGMYLNSPSANAMTSSPFASPRLTPDGGSSTLLSPPLQASGFLSPRSNPEMPAPLARGLVGMGRSPSHEGLSSMAAELKKSAPDHYED